MTIACNDPATMASWTYILQLCLPIVVGGSRLVALIAIDLFSCWSGWWLPSGAWYLLESIKISLGIGENCQSRIVCRVFLFWNLLPYCYCCHMLIGVILLLHMCPIRSAQSFGYRKLWKSYCMCIRVLQCFWLFVRFYCCVYTETRIKYYC